jgi:FKBP-type peptidyl-prolyl cis-trans isomerase (trigger factor)
MVNGHYIFLAEYERQVAQYERTLLASGIDPESEDGQSQLEQARQDVLERLIDEVLIEEGASDLGIRLNEQSIDTQLEADIAAGGGQEAFEEWLAATGQTTEDYRSVVRRSMLVRQVWEAIAGEAWQATEQDPFERWLVELRATAVIERFVSD